MVGARHSGAGRMNLADLAKALPRRELVQAYQQVFKSGMAADMVMGDLMVCCTPPAMAKTDRNGAVDQAALMIAEGRRQVIEHITSMINLDKSKLWVLAQRERQMKGESNG